MRSHVWPRGGPRAPGRQIRPLLRDGEIVGLPVLGDLDDRTRGAAWPTSSVAGLRDLSSPPSIPGMRLNAQLTRMASQSACHLIAPRGDSPQLDIRPSATPAGRIHASRHAVIPGGGRLRVSALELDSYGVAIPCAACPSWDQPAGCADFWGDSGLIRGRLAVDDSMRLVDNGTSVYATCLLRAQPGGATAGVKRAAEGIALASARPPSTQSWRN